MFLSSVDSKMMSTALPDRLRSTFCLRPVTASGPPAAPGERSSACCCLLGSSPAVRTSGVRHRADALRSRLTFVTVYRIGPWLGCIRYHIFGETSSRSIRSNCNLISSSCLDFYIQLPGWNSFSLARGDVLRSSQPAVSANFAELLQYPRCFPRAHTKPLTRNTSRQKSGWSPSNNLDSTPDRPEVQEANPLGPSGFGHSELDIREKGRARLKRRLVGHPPPRKMTLSP